MPWTFLILAPSLVLKVKIAIKLYDTSWIHLKTADRYLFFKIRGPRDKHVYMAPEGESRKLSTQGVVAFLNSNLRRTIAVPEGCSCTE
jgi:hypothetical protein